MEQKFGKVYILEREISAGKDVVVPKVLKGVRFSNTDHKWYDSDGNLSLRYQNYNGRPISVKFQLKVKDKHEKDIEFEAKLKLPLKHGELAPQDFVSRVVSENSHRDTGLEFLRDINCTTFVAALSPGCKVSEMNLLRTSCDPWFILDEWIDKSDSQKGMPFKLIDTYISAMTNIMEGKANSTIDEELQSKLKDIPTNYSKILLGVQTFRKILEEKEQLAEHVIQTFTEYHEAIIVENCSEWHQKQEDENPDMFKLLRTDLRKQGIAAPATIEMILFDKNVVVEKKVRNSFLFRSLIRTYTHHCTLVNDLMSFKKEMANGESSNTIFFLHESKGLSLQDALQKTVEKIELLTRVINEIGGMLIDFYGENTGVPQLLKTVKSIMYGNIQWCGMCGRYLPDVVFDYVVEL